MRLQKDHPLDDKCAQRFILDSETVRSGYGKARRKSLTISTKSETTRKRVKPRRRGGPPDAIELLKQAHRNIETWFAEFEKA